MENEVKKEEEPKKEEEEKIKLVWPPLESDPYIFNEYFHSVGMKDDVYFKEMLSLVDYNALLSINGPLLGVILNYSRDEIPKEGEGQKEGEIPKEEVFPKEESVPYFMRQSKKLDNACGLIAALHCFGNCKNGELKFKPDSILEKFFNKAKPLSPSERAKLLEDYDDFKKAHEHFSGKGQTCIEKQVKNDYVGHYICFVNVKGKLVEFDGIKEAPSLIKENVNDSNFLDETLKEILKRIQNKIIKEQVNVMVVADSDTQLIDFLAD